MDHAFLDAATPLAIAHRGGTEAAPENTLAAFQHAVALGLAHAETDLRASRDGTLHLFHDDDLRRLCGRRGTVEDLSDVELRACRVGGTWPVPPFEELLSAFPELGLIVDTKSDGAVAPLIALLTRQPALRRRLIVGSFSARRLAALRDAVPGLVTAAGRLEVAQALLGLPPGPARSLQVPPRAYGIDLCSPRLLRAMRRRRVQIFVWTINDAATMARLLARGVDGILTDRPGLLLRVMATGGGRSVPQE